MKTILKRTMTIGKCSVWIYGSEPGHAGLIEGKVLKVGEGFTNQREARAFGRAMIKKIPLSTHYKIGPAY
jgi:hypothetical protein